MGVNRVPRSVVVLDWLILLALVAGARLLARTLIERPGPRKIVASGREALIIGAGDAGQLIIKEMQKSTELGYTPRRFKKLLREAGFDDIQRFHNNRKRLYGNSPKDFLSHLVEPIVYRALGVFWTQIWIRAVAR